eukprot:5976946-Alexandrium_andersonii.AAC.1
MPPKCGARTARPRPRAPARRRRRRRPGRARCPSPSASRGSWGGCRLPRGTSCTPSLPESSRVGSRRSRPAR